MKSKRIVRLISFVGWAAFSACTSSNELGIETAPGFAGVSLDTAHDREERVSSLRYHLELNLPAGASDPITGRVSIRFRLFQPEKGILFDFKAENNSLTASWVNGRSTALSVSNGQIAVPASTLEEGENEVEFAFVAGNGPLNRRDEYLYSLFVPDRASETFPCFDQPGLKGKYRLSLNVPAAWQAVSNAPSVSEQLEGDRKHVEFSETSPISSYLFAFVAGKFQVEEEVVDGRSLRFFHRETDSKKLARNREALFELHGASLRWLQDYAGIEYPFEKFDFVLIPSFQFGGMEHPGAILYKDTSLLLEESATQSQLLGRASLIAHETAHMWFGNLVTMRWFNDVWMKEVFANFMAAKMVNPSFPETDHELRFLLNHHPTAYDVDRSEGTHPIRQYLDNMNDAASLYGAIIYQKAPIVMQQLELLAGEGAFRQGVQEYLRRYSYGNADWNELIEILDGLTERDLRGWSRRWVEEAGRPSVILKPLWNGDGELEAVVLEQRDPLGEGRTWMQQLRIDVRTARNVQSLPVIVEAGRTSVPLANPIASVHSVMVGAKWFPYGRFVLDESSLRYLEGHLDEIEPAVDRAAGWLLLWDSMLEGETDVNTILELGLTFIRTEKEELLLQQVLSNLVEVFWRFLDDEEREAWSSPVETALWGRLNSAQAASMKSALFKGLVSVAWSDGTLERLGRIWSGEEVVEDLALGENDLTDLALELAARQREAFALIPEQQLERVENPERKERLQFLLPAVSSDPAVRQAFSEGLRLLSNRSREPWVLSGLHYLHHPANHRQSVALVAAHLEMLETIRETGSIFFPKRWADEVLWSYGSPDVADIVRGFLERRPAYHERLKGKLLQAADGLFRAAELSAKRVERRSAVK